MFPIRKTDLTTSNPRSGAITPVTMFIGTAAKLASFAMIIRVVVEGLGAVHAS